MLVLFYVYHDQLYLMAAKYRCLMYRVGGKGKVVEKNVAVNTRTGSAGIWYLMVHPKRGNVQKMPNVSGGFDPTGADSN